MWLRFKVNQRFPVVGAVQVQTWSFSPLEEMVYNMKPSLIFWPIQKPEYKRSKLSLKVVGLSAKGSIEVCIDVYRGLSDIVLLQE